MSDKTKLFMVTEVSTEKRVYVVEAKDDCHAEQEVQSGDICPIVEKVLESNFSTKELEDN